MFRIPKLSHSAVWNPRQRAPAWRPPIGRENWLPDNQHAHLSVWIPRKELLRCGCPADRLVKSGQQQHHPANIAVPVKGIKVRALVVREPILSTHRSEE